MIATVHHSNVHGRDMLLTFIVRLHFLGRPKYRNSYSQFKCFSKNIILIEIDIKRSTASPVIISGSTKFLNADADEKYEQKM